MEGTLLIGDHLLSINSFFGGRGAWYERLLPYRPVERGDIIVFKYPFCRSSALCETRDWIAGDG